MKLASRRRSEEAGYESVVTMSSEAVMPAQKRELALSTELVTGELHIEDVPDGNVYVE